MIIPRIYYNFVYNHAGYWGDIKLLLLSVEPDKTINVYIVLIVAFPSDMGKLEPVLISMLFNFFFMFFLFTTRKYNVFQKYNFCGMNISVRV